MKIFVNAKPSSRKNRVEQLDETHFTVAVTAPPIRGEANKAIVRLLAEWFKVAPSRVEILRGHTSRKKIIEITL